ncbi:MAG: hypothetical protein IKW32_01110 [Bacteroidaceae bacterium]|nr:hypothetical protein [Bacteroidaceae bacterium]
MAIKEKYEAPQVEIIEVEVEQGFAGSNTIIGGETEEENMGGSGTGTFPW